MGIDGFFGWITKRYPLISRNMGTTSVPRIDTLFFDFNGIIHNALSLILASNIKINDTDWFAKITQIVDNIFSIVKPTSLIFISVDGTAPFAKNKEQRRRRMNSNIERSSISVGTEFMERLHNYLISLLKEKSKGEWCGIKIVYSSYKTPGEGEHKFFDFIEYMRKCGKWDENSTICLYSPDPDLILLCLSSKLHNTYLMNTCSKNITSNRSPSDFSLISINLVREYIHLDFKNTDDRIINDFIALTFLIGNDFLPNFPLQGFDFSIILDSYKQLFSGTNQYLVNDTKEGFNLTNLGKFLLELSKLQNTTQPQCDPSYVLEAFYFVFIYYKSLGVPSWEWEYPFQHTPSLSAVSEYVLSLPHDFQPHFEIGSPLLPFEQLVAVLPPKFSQLVPKCLQCSLVDADEVKLFDVREIVRTKSEFFTKEENERNKFAKNMLFDNGNITEFNLENLPNVFDDVVNLAFVPSLKSIGKVSARIEYGVVVIKNKIQCDLWSDKK